MSSRGQHWTGGPLVALLLGASGEAPAQSAIEHHTWRDRGLYEPISLTARAITGAIVLWGNPAFAEPGSTMRLTFEAGRSIDLVSVGRLGGSGAYRAASRPRRSSGSTKIPANSSMETPCAGAVPSPATWCSSRTK